MSRILVEVNEGDSSFRQFITAESIGHAMKLANTRYCGSEAKLVFPIAPEVFFVAGSSPAAEHASQETRT